MEVSVIGLLTRAWRAIRSRPVASSVALVLVLAVIVPPAYYLLSPLWIRTSLQEASPLDVAAAAASSPATPSSAAATASAAGPAGTPRLLVRGTWMGADAFHFAHGDALVIESAPQRHTVRFENFSVRNGPDLFVYLSDDPKGYGGTVLKLGALRATDGAFNYEVPAGTDVTRFKSVIVWCDQFSELFATAALQ
jgi:hypothetical protein